MNREEALKAYEQARAEAIAAKVEHVDAVSAHALAGARVRTAAAKVESGKRRLVDAVARLRPLLDADVAGICGRMANGDESASVGAVPKEGA